MYGFKDVENMLDIYPIIKAEIKNIELDIYEVENTIGFKGQSDNPRPSTPTYQFNSAVENEALSTSREKTIMMLKKEKHSRQKKIDRIENALTILTEKEEEVIRLFYFKKSPIKSIAYKIDRTESQVYRIKRYAIRSMIDILNTAKEIK